MSCKIKLQGNGNCKLIGTWGFSKVLKSNQKSYENLIQGLPGQYPRFLSRLTISYVPYCLVLSDFKMAAENHVNLNLNQFS